MFSRFLSKVFSCENRSRKLLTFSPGGSFLCAPVKSYTFLRTTATVASEVSPNEDVASTKHPSVIFKSRPKFVLNYFLNREEYRSLIVDRYNLNFETEGRPESVHILQNLVTSSEDEELIEKLKCSLVKEKEILHVEEICKCLYLFYNYKENKLAQEIISLLETELLSRKLSNLEIIKVLFTITETGRNSNTRNYLRMKLVKKICFKIKTLSPKQVVAFFYCKFKLQKDMLKLVNYDVIKCVAGIIPSLDSVELGIVVRGLLEGNFSCYSSVLKKNFLQRIMDFNGNIQELPLQDICMFLKVNIKFFDAPYALEFQEHLIPHLSKYDCKSLGCLAGIGARIGCLNLSFWEKVANIFKENINDCETHRILSMVTAMTECAVPDEELLKLAIEKFEREVEDGTIDRSDKKKNLVFFLNNLIHHEIYPKKLLDVVFADGLKYFKPDVRYGSFIKAKYWETKCWLDIDKPEFNYNSFSEEEATKLSKLSKHVLFTFKNPINYCNNMYYTLQTMRTVLVNSYGANEKVYFSNWHPVYAQGLFLRFDRNLNAQPIPTEFKDLQAYYPRKALKDDHIWIFVALVPVQHCFGTEKLKPSVQTQIRHLQAFGYVPIVVQYNTVKNHIKENTANEYLNDLIKNHLHKT